MVEYEGDNSVMLEQMEEPTEGSGNLGDWSKIRFKSIAGVSPVEARVGVKGTSGGGSDLGCSDSERNGATEGLGGATVSRVLPVVRVKQVLMTNWVEDRKFAIVIACSIKIIIDGRGRRPSENSLPVSSWNSGRGDGRRGLLRVRFLSTGSRAREDVGGPTPMPGQFLQKMVTVAACNAFKGHPGGSIDPMRIPRMPDVTNPIGG
ncbi:hypothetical protein NPIL_73821 [Nephila pilipes]|uniref:Uncharacterized protein n=1 Tax=Nephila pilipes TaxID=299642 RepID=A0A8X6TE85_NEPPI|nr:hypothetical protein NPIL_73821 [Nephila pilipes]